MVVPLPSPMTPARNETRAAGELGVDRAPDLGEAARIIPDADLIDPALEKSVGCTRGGHGRGDPGMLDAVIARPKSCSQVKRFIEIAIQIQIPDRPSYVTAAWCHVLVVTVVLPMTG